MRETDSPSEPAVPQPVIAGRRRFLSAGAAATPVLLTLASQPALGTTCFTPSRSLSKNTSVSQAGRYGDCTGTPCSSYKTQSNVWPGACPPTTNFHPAFSGSLFICNKTAGGTRSLTMMEVMNLPTKPADISSVPTDPSGLGYRMVGAYLNILNNKVPANVLTTTTLSGMWTEWSTATYFTPVAGTKWYAADIVSYLTTSGIAP